MRSRPTVLYSDGQGNKQNRWACECGDATNAEYREVT